MARMKKAEALKLLAKMRDAVPRLKKLPRNSPDFKRWHRNTEANVKYIFGDNTTHSKDVQNIAYRPVGYMTGDPDSVFEEAYVRGLELATSILKSMMKEIEQYWEDDNQGEEINALAPSETARPATNKVFVVHGHDGEARETVARLLEKLGLQPIVLHEQANAGHTIIEKFEENADVGFAVILLTPDDAGASKKNKNAPKDRARQNVILEMGFFIGKLGRERVAVLLKSDLEKPSDTDGILYIPLDDAGGWQLSLVRELKAAGFDVDANRAL